MGLSLLLFAVAIVTFVEGSGKKDGQENQLGDFIDNIPGADCTGSTSLYDLTVHQAVMTVEHAENDVPDKKFIGRFVINLPNDPRYVENYGNCCWSYFSL